MNIKKELFRQQQVKFYHLNDFLNQGFSIIVNIERIIGMVHNEESKKGPMVNPKYILERIESLYSNKIL